MKNPKAQSVEAFLLARKSNPRWNGGRKCRTCCHPKVEAINRELRTFAKAKSDGHEMPWARFFKDRLHEVYGLNAVPTAVMRHVTNCLGLR